MSSLSPAADTVARRNILFIGGTGVISAAAAEHAVADFISFTPEHVRAGMELFRGRMGQYVFISSASAYQKPPMRLPVMESTPLRNPFWQYSRDNCLRGPAVHGVCTLTHSRDFAKAFVGLLGRPQAVGESYTITSDEYLPWNQIYRLFARAAGVAEPELVHVASESIAAHSPERRQPAGRQIARGGVRQLQD